MRTLLLGTLALWRRRPGLGAPAALAALVLPLMPAYLALRVFLPLWRGEHPRHVDFSFYYEAAGRFLADPLALYPGPTGFIYPPPAVLLYAPFQAFGPVTAAAVMTVLNAALAVLAVRLALRLYARWQGEPAPASRATAYVLGMASGPVFQNLRFAQANVLVLLSGLAFLLWLERRPVVAGLVLAGGFWFKLYPLVLAPLTLRASGWVRAALAAGLLGLPVLLLPVVPAELYREYVFELLPHWSGATCANIMNESVMGVLVRAGTSVEAAISLPATVQLVEVPPVIAAVNGVLAVVLIGGLVGGVFVWRLPAPVAGVALLAAVPVLTSLGWEHTYVLALPLLLFAALAAQERGPVARGMVGGCWFALLAPMPPGRALGLIVDAVPRPLFDLYMARYLLATLLALGLVVAWAWRPNSARG